MADDIANLIIKKLKHINDNILPNANEAYEKSLYEIKQKAIKIVIDAINKGGIFKVDIYKGSNSNDTGIIHKSFKSLFETKGYTCPRYGNTIWIYWENPKNLKTKKNDI